jgi:(p)ppGpp synthase/HD superfamily hydrolase
MQRLGGMSISPQGRCRGAVRKSLLEVATLVAIATDGKDPELVIAALLHDSIEDQEVLRTVIAEAFGDAVADIVEEVIDDNSIGKQERKQLQIKHASKKSRGAKILKLADKTSNLRAIAGSPPLTGRSSAGSNMSVGRVKLQKA